MPRAFQSKRSSPPTFSPVRLRARMDGWSPAMQCAFLAQLYLTGSVAAAAQAVGKSRASAYKLRERPDADSFADAWDHILAGPPEPGQRPRSTRRATRWRKLTLRDLKWRIETGLLRPVIYRGKYRAIAQKPDNSALLRLLSRYDSLERRTLGRGT